MSLPTINTPTYELELPSSKETIKYRPFLVKEEKLLLMAMEEDDEKQMIGAIRQIVNNCTFEQLEVPKMPMFDLEYVFLRIRSKSVGEVASLRLLCDDDGKTYADVDIPLEEVEVQFQEKHTNIIDVTEDIKVEMSYPTFEMVNNITEGSTKEVFDLIGKCVSKVIEGETVYERTDWTKKELNAFLDSLSSQQFQDIQEFFETMPKLSYEVEYENPETKKKNKRTLEGMQSFFA